MNHREVAGSLRPHAAGRPPRPPAAQRAPDPSHGSPSSRRPRGAQPQRLTAPYELLTIPFHRGAPPGRLLYPRVHHAPCLSHFSSHHSRPPTSGARRAPLAGRANALRAPLRSRLLPTHRPHPGCRLLANATTQARIRVARSPVTAASGPRETRIRAGRAHFAGLKSRHRISLVIVRTPPLGRAAYRVAQLRAGRFAMSGDMAAQRRTLITCAHSASRSATATSGAVYLVRLRCPYRS